MNKLLYLFSFTIFLSFFNLSCQNTEQQDKDISNISDTISNPVKQDTVLLYLDSTQIIDFLTRYPLTEEYKENIRSFYKKRNNAFAWINNYGINEYAGNFINLLNHEEMRYSNDSSFYNERLHVLYNGISEDYKIFGNDSLVAELEILLSVNLFDYANRNWRGISDEKLREAGWFIARKNLNYEDLLDSLLKSKVYLISAFDPVYPQYALLKKHLIKYNDIEKRGGWKVSFQKGIELKKGDTSSVITAIKEQLCMMGDLAVTDSTNFFNDELVSAVKKFQKRHGLKENGLIEEKTLQQLSVPVHERIKQILINMERSRWVPAEQKGEYLVVNIPDFKLFVFQNDSLEWSCNVIVGESKVTNNTVIFNDNLEYIVFSPYWNIPKNILIKETLPAIKRNPDYLSSHNMEVVDVKGKPVASSSINWSQYKNNFPYIIRQKPGENNALGSVKFLFPNSYEIYMHDTPEKSLFGETTRTFSHGCIRLEEPYKLVKFLLREDTSWTDENIIASMYGGKQTFVKLKNKVPVFIAYFTAWVDRNGNMNFRNDVYSHDEKMKQLLFAD
ncbi:MAG: L,D-transpeptidase family protein [Bacteroidetes bacterium]|nr:L,D-transpeptidase family protein [Bacteroidota bacterium]MBK8875493.1 L,D-transpeptidase family protein [Bacteroidota bacterium]MBK9423013.1 L,D-transpeptidase family protein [Bacteroidota bacterium]MBL0072268.1 L,D-transpeptidase family protein [Bacteroidota bacterium]